jgi:hypothetical protein
MAWELLLVRVPAEARRLDDLPHGFWPAPFEPAPELVARLRPLAGFELVDDSLGVLRADEYVLEIELASPTRIFVRVEGSDRALDALRMLAQALDARAIDCGSGAILDLADPISALGGLRRARASQELLDELVDSTPSVNDPSPPSAPRAPRTPAPGPARRWP